MDSAAAAAGDGVVEAGSDGHSGEAWGGEEASHPRKSSSSREGAAISSAWRRCAREAGVKDPRPPASQPITVMGRSPGRVWGGR